MHKCWEKHNIYCSQTEWKLVSLLWGTNKKTLKLIIVKLHTKLLLLLLLLLSPMQAQQGENKMFTTLPKQPHNTQLTDNSKTS